MKNKLITNSRNKIIKLGADINQIKTDQPKEKIQ